MDLAMLREQGTVTHLRPHPPSHIGWPDCV